MRSKFEERFATDLTARGIDYWYEPLRLRYAKAPGVYTPDFWLRCAVGGILIETKGLFTSADRTKMIAVKRAHPDRDIRLVFQRAKNTLSKTSKTTYAMWAEKHGFLWAEKVVPDAWLA